MKLRFFASILAAVVFPASGATALDLVRDGSPAAVIATADDAPPVVAYAAQELAWHIEKATGARLPVVSESQLHKTSPAVCIHLGDTAAAHAAGIESRLLPPETFVLRSTPAALIIAGGDGLGEPLGTGTPGGTLFGVYEFLERELGVIWAWPGELGTYVPKKPDLAVRDEVDLTLAPPFLQRHVRGGLSFKGKFAELGFTPAAAEAYAREQAVFLRRHRMGKRERISYGHVFPKWWEQYGAEHPEWFQLHNGKRGPAKPGASYSMCVSNPGLHQKLVALWLEQRAKNPPEPGAASYLNACENGVLGLCECDDCLAWDGPRPDDYDDFYAAKSKMKGSRFVTDRYVKYWLAVQAEARRTDPGVVVIAYNYYNYFHAPTPGLKLNANFLIGSYPSGGGFPRSPEKNAWYRRQWLGWRDTGARLFSRGNQCLDGYTMPHIYAHEFSEEFRFMAENGMVATDYDALTGQWAAHGPNIYALMRLHVTPAARTDAILDRYYSVFGPAAALVKEYFTYWENYTRDNRARLEGVFEEINVSRSRNWPVAAHRVHPPECFAPAEAILARAAQAAAGDPEAAARVEFLRAGLSHSRLCARISELLTTADPRSTLARGRTALDELIAFRRAHEREWIANFNHCAWEESTSWVLTDAPRKQ
ncbi:DUF4838 domain-containing protein [Termitidicoccus mucosus]